MNKKIKRFATTTIICILVASIFGSVMVFGPPPDFIFPELIDVFVTNTSDDPVPVDITDSTIDVNLDEPIEVTNPSGESLNVEVTNPDDITLDASGWLHTTQEMGVDAVINVQSNLLVIECEGFREITLGFLWRSGADCEFRVGFGISGHGAHGVYFEVDVFTLTAQNWIKKETYSIRGSYMVVVAEPSNAIDTDVSACYFMTT